MLKFLLAVFSIFAINACKTETPVIYSKCTDVPTALCANIKNTQSSPKLDCKVAGNQCANNTQALSREEELIKDLVSGSKTDTEYQQNLIHYLDNGPNQTVNATKLVDAKYSINGVINLYLPLLANLPSTADRNIAILKLVNALDKTKQSTVLNQELNGNTVLDLILSKYNDNDKNVVVKLHSITGTKTNTQTTLLNNILTTPPQGNGGQGTGGQTGGGSTGSNTGGNPNPPPGGGQQTGGGNQSTGGNSNPPPGGGQQTGGGSQGQGTGGSTGVGNTGVGNQGTGGNSNPPPGSWQQTGGGTPQVENKTIKSILDGNYDWSNKPDPNLILNNLNTENVSPLLDKLLELSKNEKNPGPKANMHSILSGIVNHLHKQKAGVLSNALLTFLNNGVSMDDIASIIRRLDKDYQDKDKYKYVNSRLCIQFFKRRINNNKIELLAKDTFFQKLGLYPFNIDNNNYGLFELNGIKGSLIYVLLKNNLVPEDKILSLLQITLPTLSSINKDVIKSYLEEPYTNGTENESILGFIKDNYLDIYKDDEFKELYTTN